MAGILNISRYVLKRRQWKHFTTRFSLQRPGLPPYSGSGWLPPFDESVSPHGRQSEQQWNCWKKEEGNKNVWKKIATYELLPLCYVCILRFWQSVSPSDLKSLCHRGHPKKRNENMDPMHIWNLLPDHRLEEKKGDLMEGHTWYLSFFLHGQNFWRLKFTPKNT